MYGDVFCIYLRILFEIIHGSTQPPGPGSNAAPFIRLGLAIESMHAILKPIIKVWINISIVKKRCAVATRD